MATAQHPHWWSNRTESSDGHALALRAPADRDAPGAAGIGAAGQVAGLAGAVGLSGDGSGPLHEQDAANLPACRQSPQPDIGDPLRMRTEPADPVTESAASPRSEDKGSPAASFSQFLSKIFEQLSISAWLPAAMLIGNVAILLQLRTNGSYNLGPAFIDLAKKPLGTIVILVFAVVLATMVTQAFEFEVIQLLPVPGEAAAAA